LKLTAGSGEMVFSILALPTPGDHDLYKLEFAVFQEAFV
jgi:hypothetical protein